jgi:hypothetical protein
MNVNVLTSSVTHTEMLSSYREELIVEKISCQQFCGEADIFLRISNGCISKRWGTYHCINQQMYDITSLFHNETPNSEQ